MNLVSNPVFPDPCQKAFIIHLPGGDGKTDSGNLIVGAVQTDAVDLQKGQHDTHADPFVAVHKSVVSDQRIAEPCSLFFFGGVKLLPAEGGENALQRGFQKPLVPDTDTAAGLLRDQFR